MSVRRWNPPEVPPPFAFYSHLAEAPAGSRVVAMSGQVGVRADGSFPESLEEQFEVALANVIAIASAGGKGEADIMKLLVFLTDRRQTSPA